PGRALRRRHRRRHRLRLRPGAAGPPLARRAPRAAARPDSRARRPRREARARPGEDALAGVPRRHARDHVLGFPRALHGNGPRDDRLRHHGAAPRLQAPEGLLLPRLRDRARPVRALLRARPRHGSVAPLRAPPRAHRSDRAIRGRAGPAPRHQRDRVRHGGVPPRGGARRVGGVGAGRRVPGAGRGGRGRVRACAAGTAPAPKQIIVKLKRHMHGELPGPIHGELIRPEELWACTTCMACVEECPAFIDIVDTIIDLRRYLALSEGALPSTAPQSLQNIQRAGNPWGLPAGERLAWAQGLDVPVMEPGREVEYLYWVGCSASYDRRNQAIARAVVKILKAARVTFGVMQEERCHGEVARRLGEEYLYQTLQQANVAATDRYRLRTWITHRP